MWSTDINRVSKESWLSARFARALKPEGPKINRRLWLSGALMLILFVAMAIHSSPLSPSIPVIQLTFDEAAFKAVLAQWGPNGVELFRTHFFIDFSFLTSYGVFGYLLARHVTRRHKTGPSAGHFLIWALPAAAALDACENLLHLSFIAYGAHPMPGAYLLAGVVASSKWLLIATFVIGLIVVQHGLLRSTGKSGQN